jgi:hypothetical protein
LAANNGFFNIKELLQDAILLIEHHSDNSIIPFNINLDTRTEIKEKDGRPILEA